ncbi:bifunctional lysylphosphatidylglycerol flippase/synthetase MprF [Rathayibacter sp. KR2-224]|uniref:bifunctional lysylphosphatidylglycerol flippase/synthetase MprF n=1 Tax=Rathayibacter sp. KR2-224 TaxID=3400913 RepID=UPI003C071C6F
MTASPADTATKPRRPMMNGVVDAAAHVPFTIVFLVVVTLGTVLVSTPSGVGMPVKRMLATGFDPLGLSGHWWSPFTSLFIAPDYLALAFALVLGGIGLVISERSMGTLRTVFAFFVTAAAADVLGATFQAVVGSAGGIWSESVRDTLVLDPLTGVAGAVMAASAFTSVRTRRRIRVLTTVMVLMFLLYRGGPEDIYRSLAVLVGFALGLVLAPSGRARTWGWSSHHEVRVFMASVVATGAIGPIIAALSRNPHGLLAPISLLLDNGSSADPQGLRACSVYAVSHSCVQAITLERIGSFGPIVLSVLPLLMLILVSWGLARGRRFAVGLGIAMNALLAFCAAYYLGFLPRTGISGVQRLPDHGSWGVVATLGATVIAPVATAVLLFATRRNFTVMPTRRSVMRYLTIVAVGVVALIVLYVGVGWALRGVAFDRPITIADLLLDAVERFVPVEFLHREIPDFLPSSPAGRILYHGVGPLFWLVAIIAAVPPLLTRPASSAHDAERARRILRTHGGDHLSFMTTWPMTSYWFGPDGRTAVGYRVVGGVAITIGAAFGAREQIADAMAGFARFCDERGWLPVFYSVDAGEWDAYFDGIGWDRLVVAEEAVIDPQSWSTTGKKWQDIRTAINRAKRDGFSLEWTRYADLPRETAAQIADLSEQWVAQKELPEMGFTLGGLDELRDRDVALLLARDGEGAIQAVTSWMPGFGGGRVRGWTLDFMRRRIDGPNGVMEYVIAGAAERARDDGMEYLSLSAAPLARTTTADAPESAIEAVLALLASSLEAMYGFRSLLAFKRKFQPELRPLLLAYPDPVSLPVIGLALLRAYLPGLTVRDAMTLLGRQRGEPVAAK